METESKQVELKTEVLGQLLGLPTSAESRPIEYKLSIPDYQRIYSWEEKNVIRLLDDIYRHTDSTYYFFEFFIANGK